MYYNIQEGLTCRFILSSFPTKVVSNFFFPVYSKQDLHSLLFSSSQPTMTMIANFVYLATFPFILFPLSVVVQVRHQILDSTVFITKSCLVYDSVFYTHCKFTSVFTLLRWFFEKRMLSFTFSLSASKSFQDALHNAVFLFTCSQITATVLMYWVLTWFPFVLHLCVHKVSFFS